MEPIPGMNPDELLKPITRQEYLLAGNITIKKRDIPLIWDLLQFPGSNFPGIVTEIKKPAGDVVEFKVTNFPWRLSNYSVINWINVCRFRFLLWIGKIRIQ